MAKEKGFVKAGQKRCPAGCIFENFGVRRVCDALDVDNCEYPKCHFYKSGMKYEMDGTPLRKEHRKVRVTL